MPLESRTISFPKFITVGFVGARRLSPRDGEDEDVAAAALLRQRIGEVLDDLTGSLAPAERLSAVSALAAGADTVFAEEAAARGILQQVFLPTVPDGFFTLKDFFNSEPRIQRAKAVMGGSNVVEVRVVSESPDRRTRFTDCGYSIVHECNVLVAVLPPEEEAQATAKPGGTLETVNHATAAGLPVYRIILGAGMPVVRPDELSGERFRPKDTQEWSISVEGPDTGPYELVGSLKAAASAAARRGKTHFHVSAVAVMATHLTATTLAVVAEAWFPDNEVLPWVKVALLLLGLGVFYYLHRSRPQRGWVHARLVAELCRSVISVRGLPGHLGYLRDFHIPGCRGLIQSLCLLHLSAGRGAPADLGDFAVRYLGTRIGDGDKPSPGSQIAHYRERSREARGARLWLDAAFYVLTVVALLCAAYHAVSKHGEVGNPWQKVGFWLVPVMFPILAAAAASWVSVLDLDRRVELYESMIGFLEHQARHIRMAMANQRILVRAVHRSEHSLLQEVVEWHAKHAHLRGN